MRTFNAKPWPSHKAAPFAALPDSALSHFSRAISIPTVSPQDPSRIDTGSFLRYRSFVESAYPLIHQRLSREIVTNFSYIYTWKGTDPSLPPLILMAHYDVVPVEISTEKLWTAPPFGGNIIPASQISPVSTSLASYLPDPTNANVARWISTN